MKSAEDHAMRRPQLVVASSAAWIVLCSLMAIRSANAQIALPGSGVINTIAGNGTAGYGGDNGNAVNAELQYPSCVAVDSKWNVYIADYYNNRIRKIAASTGVITTVAGNGTAGYSGDGGAATSAELNYPSCVAVDGSGNIYVADTSNNRIRMVAASTGIITTVAGNGSYGYGGDGGAATNAYLALPAGVAADTCGNLYIADTGNNRIRKVPLSTGTISTVAGNGTAGYSGDGGSATSAKINYPNGIAVDSSCNFYFADTSNERVRKVTISSGIITTVAGNGTVGFSGDGGAATSAELGYPYGVAIDTHGNIYIGDNNNNRVREVTISSGIISTVAGNGVQGYSGDGGAATSGEMNGLQGVAVDSSGNIYIADESNSRIRAVGAWSGSSPPSAPASPSFSPSSGKYVGAQSVTISDTTNGATIYYTTDGTTPTTSSAQYTSPIGVSTTETINAIAVSGSLSSAVATATFIVGDSPSFSPVPGTYGSAQTVSITSTDFGATIYYTTNGTTPTTSSTPYTGPIGVSTTETLKAIAVLGAASSPVSTGTYTINTASQKSSTATITIGGSEQSGDANNITVSFNGFKETVNYGPYSTSTSIASAFGAKFANDYVPVGLYAKASGNVITFVWLGTTPFSSLDVEGSTTSFQLTSSGFASQGSTVVDTGTVTLTVGGVVAAQTNYGAGATSSSIAEGLATNVTSGSFVNITASNNDLYLVSKQAGAGTNYSYTLQTTTWDSADFSQPSFANPPINGNLSGGVNGSSGSGGQQTIYSYNIPSYTLGQQPTGYDGVGNIVGYTDSVMGGWGFSYDPLYRMTSGSAATGAYAGVQASWGYDAFGNRQSETFSGTSQMPMPTSSTASYNANNQISSSSLMLGAAVQYDASGDVTQDNQNLYLYNGDGQVCAVKNTYTGTMTGYVYGADGTRVSIGTISTWGSCDPNVNGYQAMKDSIAGPTGGQMTETGVDANGNVVWEHTNVWVGGNLMATYDANGVHFLLNDWNGSRRVQTDYQGVVEQTCTSLPYGNGTTCSADPSEYLFAGLQQEDNPGLESAAYRQYASYMGRWNSPDPYGGSYNWADPQSLNRYAYVVGNPLAMSDPSGLDWEDGCFLPAYSSTITCTVSVGAKAAQFFGLSSTALDASPFFAAAGPVGMLADAGYLFYDVGEGLGWWGGSPFHGSVAASQSGKNVPSFSGFHVPGPPEEDGMADNPLAQALFHGGGRPYWGGANSMVTDATIGYAGAIGATVLAPAAVDAGLTSLAESYGASLATANGTNGVMIGAYYQGSAYSYEAVAAEQGMNFFELPGYNFWQGLGGYGQIANDAFTNAAIESGQTIFTSSTPWMTGGVGYWSETGILSNAGVSTVPFFPYYFY